jgi:hypothetical protein
MFLRHASGESTELHNQQVLGDESPLEFDEDGYAEVDDDVGTKLLAMHRHVERGGHGPSRDEEGADDTADEFDAAAFVDRTPMEDVVQDIKSGEYDEHLDAIEAAAERNGVQDAIDERRG